MTNERRNALRAWAAFDDVALDDHGTDTAVEARRCANRIARDLGDFTDDDLRVIDAARRGYRAERAA